MMSDVQTFIALILYLILSASSLVILVRYKTHTKNGQKIVYCRFKDRTCKTELIWAIEMWGLHMYCGLPLCIWNKRVKHSGILLFKIASLVRWNIEALTMQNIMRVPWPVCKKSVYMWQPLEHAAYFCLVTPIEEFFRDKLFLKKSSTKGDL